MEFADNYLLIGLIAAIVVLIVFIIWYHTRKKNVECCGGYPFMKNPLPTPDKSNYKIYASRLKVIDEASRGKLRCDFAFGKFIHDKGFDPNQIDDSAFDIWLLEAFINPRSVHKSTSKIPSFDQDVPLPEKPRKPVMTAPDQFRYHKITPCYWSQSQRRRYVSILGKYLKLHPDKGFGGLLDYFCMDCGYNAKWKDFLASVDSCPHCQSFRIKPVPYLPQAE